MAVRDTEIHHSICACLSPEHVVQWMYQPQERYKSKTTGEEFLLPGEVWFSVCVSWNQSFFKRCWNAIRYIFGHRSNYGHFDCFTLERSEARKLVAFLQEYANEPDEIIPVKRDE